MLTMYNDLAYVMKHNFEDLKYVLSDVRISLNEYRDAPTLESITRAARHVREVMGIEPDGRRKRQQEEMRQAYSTQARLEF